MHRVASRQGGMSRISSTASLKGDAERQEAASGWLHCWPHVRTQRGLLTVAMCLLLVCAAFMGVFGYGFGLGRLADRQEIIVRGVAYVHTAPQRSIQQVESSSAPSAPSRVTSLEDVDTVMANLEGLCSEEQSWSQQELGMEQCIQGPWSGEAFLPVGGGGSYGGGRAPSGQEGERRSSGSSRALLARHPGKGLLRHYGSGSGSGGGSARGNGLKRHSRRLGEASECGAALGIPKVALLFLTKGPMPLEQAWTLWLRATSGALRVDCLARRVCGGPDEYALLTAVNAACGGAGGGNATAAALSHLFSIYIHPSPSHKGYARGSIFRGREISPRVKVEWGSWSIMEATRLLLRAALEDPLNQRFVFLSEACAPLIPAAAMYAQLMSEPKSRINACNAPGANLNLDRYDPGMEQGPMSKMYWRKSAQWSSLIRKHAQLVADDMAVADIFAKYCRVGKDKKTGKQHACISDEHYIPSLLAINGVEAETDCSGAMTYVHWWGDGEHMQLETFYRDEVSGDLIEQMRMSDFGCENAAAIAAAPNVLTSMEDMATKRCGWRPQEGYPSGLLGPSCHLFARKWDQWANDAMVDLFELEDTLQLLEGRTGACEKVEPRVDPLLGTLTAAAVQR